MDSKWRVITVRWRVGVADGSIILNVFRLMIRQLYHVVNHLSRALKKGGKENVSGEGSHSIFIADYGNPSTVYCVCFPHPCGG